MGTQDEETRRFFKHSSVQVLLCPRSAGKRHSWVKQQVIPVAMTYNLSIIIDNSFWSMKVLRLLHLLNVNGFNFSTM